MMNMDIVLLSLTVIMALSTVMGRSLLRAAMSLAITSALLSVLIFRLGSPLAAVLELSVCAGLITAIFVSTISMTKPLTHKEILRVSKDKLRRYIYLPIILIIVGLALVLLKTHQDFITVRAAPQEPDVRAILWNFRRLDLLGQVIILIAGALGIAILFEEKKTK